MPGTGRRLGRRGRCRQTGCGLRIRRVGHHGRAERLDGASGVAEFEQHHASGRGQRSVDVRFDLGKPGSVSGSQFARAPVVGNGESVEPDPRRGRVGRSGPSVGDLCVIDRDLGEVGAIDHRPATAAGCSRRPVPRRQLDPPERVEDLRSTEPAHGSQRIECDGVIGGGTSTRKVAGGEQGPSQRRPGLGFVGGERTGRACGVLGSVDITRAEPSRTRQRPCIDQVGAPREHLVAPAHGTDRVTGTEGGVRKFEHEEVVVGMLAMGTLERNRGLRRPTEAQQRPAPPGVGVRNVLVEVGECCGRLIASQSGRDDRQVDVTVDVRPIASGAHQRAPSFDLRVVRRDGCGALDPRSRALQIGVDERRVRCVEGNIR